MASFYRAMASHLRKMHRKKIQRQKERVKEKLKEEKGSSVQSQKKHKDGETKLLEDLVLVLEDLCPKQILYVRWYQYSDV